MELGEVERRIVAELQKNARLSMRELAALVGVSTPTASAKVKQLEAMGVIRGYTVVLDGEDTASEPPTLAAKVRCHECGGPIEGAGIHKHWPEDGERDHWFCCRNCATLFGERLVKLSKGGRR